MTKTIKEPRCLQVLPYRANEVVENQLNVDSCRNEGSAVLCTTGARRDLGEASFSPRSYPFGQLAQLYYPDRNQRSAIRLFREELMLTRGLWDALADVGYKPYCKVLTRGQVKTIVKYLGEP